MSIIAISKGSFSGGKLLAEGLARKLDYRCIDRDALVQRAATHGVSPHELLAALDHPPASGFSTLDHRKYIYLALMQDAFADEVSAGNAVYHGLVGHLLLPKDLTVLRLRVIATMERRIGLAQEQMRVNRQQAIEHIAQNDAQRGRWTRYIYGIDWEDPSLYDVVINLERISVEQACQFIGGMILDGAFKFTSQDRAAMNDFVQAARVRAALARNHLTSNLEVEVASRAGQVTIKGEFYEETDEIQRVVAAVPDVVSVSLAEPEPARVGGGTRFRDE